MNLCSKPACARRASAVLAYDYAARIAVLEDPPDSEASPHLYPLCNSCADQLHPPRGWDLVDLRSGPRLFAPPPPDVGAPAKHRAAWG